MILGSGEARAQTNTFVAEQGIQAIPLDVEVTPNGAVAVVRGNLPNNIGPSDEKLSFWRTDTGARLLPQPNQTNMVGRGNLPIHSQTGLPMFSDAIAVTNDRVVAIGSADTDPSSYPGEDTLYVDILEVTYPAGVPSITIKQRHALFGTPNGLPESKDRGYAHDVAITPDGSLAVVTSRNFVHVFYLADGSLAMAVPLTSQQTLPCSPYWSRNSVEVTNTRAVVAVSRGTSGLPSAIYRPWVYIIDLSQTSDPYQAVLLEYDQYPAANYDQNPHDIAITPDGTRAVVTATHSVGLYDLANAAVIGVFDDHRERRWSYLIGGGEPEPVHVPDLWHSVEVSNNRAVVLGNYAYSTSNPGVAVWNVRVFDITSGLNSLAVYEPNGLETGNDPGWDLNLATDGALATIKTRGHDLAVLDVNNPTSLPLFKAGPTAGSGYPSTSSGSPGINDATVILAPVSYEPAAPRWAVFTGTPGGSSGNLVRLRFYNLAATSGWGAGSPAVVDQPLSEAVPSGLLFPADLELSPSGTDVLARCAALYAEPNMPQPGPDWSRWSGNPPAQAGTTLGGQGTCVGADSLRMRRRSAVSISRDPDPQIAGGWVHIVQVQ